MSHNVMCNFTHHPSKTSNFFISGECGGGKLCEDKKCQEIRQTGAVIFAQVICTITATFLSTNAHLISSHLDYEFDVLNSKWTGRYRSPKQLARLILHTLRYIEKKGNHLDYYRHEYDKNRNKHIHRWRIDVPKSKLIKEDGPTGVFWADGKVWHQWSASIWIDTTGLQGVFPNGNGTDPNNPTISRKWLNPTNEDYIRHGPKYQSLISRRNYSTIIQIILHFIFFTSTYYIKCVQFHKICIPELFAAHEANCVSIQGSERDIVMGNIESWKNIGELHGTNENTYRPNLQCRVNKV